ncbi:MAG: septum formation initiator family protein [Parcubacteria group bacterium]|nr:septum formation initiator family protein [Parcubacteria group bacterium]
MQRFQIFLRWLPIVSLFCVGLLVGRETWKRYENYAQLRGRLDALRADMRITANENRSISKQIEWYNDPAHLEEKAKRELNLKKEGEEVIIIDERIVTTTTQSSSKPNEEKKPWWGVLFFRNE